MTTVKRAALWALVTALLVLAIEGLASTYVAVSSALESFFRSGERPAQHDPDLGWVNRPGLFNPDLYGPGMWARINSQGFRDDRTVPKAVADGQVRLICSGDSFTFGYGVSNDTTWCHALREIDARIDSVNMGVNGDGVDQAYLRYLRDAKDIEHDVHLFAFIADDFTRMRSGAYRLDSKPTLVVEGGRLSVRGVPVEPPSTASRLLPVLRRAARGLRTGALAQRALPPIGTSRANRPDRIRCRRSWTRSSSRSET
jgi:hypothetical protein